MGPRVYDVVYEVIYSLMKTRKMNRAYCWTLNNPTSEEIEAINQSTLRYIVYGHEIAPETGTPHLQGYLEATRGYTMVAIKKMPGFGRAHIEARNGTRDEARDYCMKDGKYVERGDWQAGGQGQRSDLPKTEAKYREWYEQLRENPNVQEFIANNPEAAFRYPNGVRMVLESVKQQHLQEQMAIVFEGFQPRNWQADLLAELEKNPHPRKVIWYVDETGGKGKTHVANYILSKGDAAYFRGGRTADIAYRYNGERIALFDFSRTNEEYTNYQAIECLKDGLIDSPKYTSVLKQFLVPHVVCFSNFMPDRSKLSQDRWDIRLLDDPKYNTTPPMSPKETPDMPIAEALRLAEYIPASPVQDAPKWPLLEPYSNHYNLITVGQKSASQSPTQNAPAKPLAAPSDEPLGKHSCEPDCACWWVGGQDNVSSHESSAESDDETTSASEELSEGGNTGLYTRAAPSLHSEPNSETSDTPLSSSDSSFPSTQPTTPANPSVHRSPTGRLIIRRRVSPSPGCRLYIK